MESIILTEKEKANIKKNCIDHIRRFHKNGDDDLSTTAWVPLKRIGEKYFAIVFGYLDGYDEECADIIEKSNISDETWYYCLNGKVAYQNYNTMMSDYDTDWYFFYIDGSDLEFTSEVSIGKGDGILEIDWLIEEAQSILKAAYLLEELNETIESDDEEDEADFMIRMAEAGIKLEDYKLVDRYDWAVEIANGHGVYA